MNFMKRSLAIVLTISSLPTFAIAELPNPSCTVILRETVTGSDHVQRVVRDAKAFNALIRQELEKKHYNIIEQTGPIADGDIEVESYLDYGIEPYFPVLKTCIADIGILQTVRAGWETKRLFQKVYKKQRLSVLPMNCLKKVQSIIKEIPDCE